MGFNKACISATMSCLSPECATFKRFKSKTSRLIQEEKKSLQVCRGCAPFYANCLPIQQTITYSLLPRALCCFKSVSFVPLPPPHPTPPSFHLLPPTQCPFMHEITEPTAVEGGWRIPVVGNASVSKPLSLYLHFILTLSPSCPPLTIMPLFPLGNIDLSSHLPPPSLPSKKKNILGGWLDF